MKIEINRYLDNKIYSSIETASLPARKEIDEKYKWDLSHIYSNENLWDEDFKWIENNLINYKKFEGKLSLSAKNLFECLQFDDSIGIKLERLHLYASLAKDSDMRVTKYQAMDDRTTNLFMQVSTASSFIKPEILSIHEDKLLQMIDSLEELKIYKHLFEDLVRTKIHTLDKEKEELLALSSEISLTPYNTFSILTNADFKFPKVADEEGNEIEMSHARYYSAMYSYDRDFRARAFKNYLAPYKNFANTFSVLFNGNLKVNIFNAKARKYESVREASLNRNNIPLSVYDNLIESANNNLKPLHRWASMKKRFMKIDELHPYDIYVTLFPSTSEKKYSYEEAKEIVLESLKVLGDDYLTNLKNAFDNRWIDVHETQAKRSGAYSSGTTFGVHPYVLLNWGGLINDVFTLAHEMGHNMHSFYTGKTQPYPYANYTIFLAEVASTFNESLLLDYLIENSSSKEEKLNLLEKYLNNITATFYRQTMFAEFEMSVYEKTEKGEALTPDTLSKMYYDVYQKYWGPEMVIDEEEKYTWARIPHFYYNFYVYQYATGFSASEILVRKVKHGGKEDVDKYLNFLKSGSSDYSINILKTAGVDMNSPEPVKATSEKMDEILNEIESLI
ncbi:MAG: oligoendopeptidase F [Ignavibacteriaceae bacterium]